LHLSDTLIQEKRKQARSSTILQKERGEGFKPSTPPDTSRYKLFPPKMHFENNLILQNQKQKKKKEKGKRASKPVTQFLQVSNIK